MYPKQTFPSASIFAVLATVVTVVAVVITHLCRDKIDGSAVVMELTSDDIKVKEPNPLLKLKAQSEAAQAMHSSDAVMRIIYSIGQIQTQRETDGKPNLIDRPVDDLDFAASWIESLAKETLESTPHNTLEQLRNARPK